MASIQERLQLKRVPLDKWSTKEKLCLASAVACSGDQNWMSVSRSLKMLCGTHRPTDWFSQKSCAAQYGKLLENVETPKRKKRTASERDGVATVETPGESICRKLSQERIIELKKIIQEEAQQYTKVKEDIILIQSGVTDEKKLREMWKQIQMEKAQKEKEQILHAQWLKEREEKKLELERQWRPLFPGSPNSQKMLISPGVKIKEETDDDSQSSSKSGTSPLLTSLLKSPSANPSGAQVLPSSGSSRSAASPTITNLLTGNSPTTMNIHAKNLFPVSGSESTQLEVNQSVSRDDTKFNTAGSSAYQVAPNLTKLLDNSMENQVSTSHSVQEAQKLIESSGKTEDLDTDPDAADPAKDLMAVFQELMPEELDEILNDNSGMILEDEILDNVVDSIMEEEEEEEEGHLKGKDLNALEAANLLHSSMLDDQQRNESKNEEGSTSEEVKGAYLKPAAAAPSPQQLAVFEQDSALVKEEDETLDPLADSATERVDGVEETGTEGNQAITNKDELKERETQPLKSTDEENEIIPIEDSSSSSPVSIPSSVDIKEKTEPIELDSIKGEEAVITKTESEDDIEQKPVTLLDTDSSASDSKALVVKLEAQTETKHAVDKAECSKSDLTNNKTPVESKQSATTLTSEEEAARAKKEALEKLAAEYDFKDDEEPIVPLSIQKSKDEKHIHEEDVFLDAQENLDEVEGSKETEQKKHEDSVVTITDTDDDSLIEMKISKTKRDYSRRRTVEELFKPKDDHLTSPKNEESEVRSLRKLRDRDRSISPFVMLDDDASEKMKRSYSSTPVLDSVPSSPASSEDRDYRVWKKSILTIHSKISSLRQASAFMKPVPDEHTSDMAYRPMDLSTIKKNVENGTIRTTAEYQRDVMLIYVNALVLNREEFSPKAAKYLMNECVTLIDSIMETGKTNREKEVEGRGSSVNKRSSRKGTTRSSTSTTRN